MPGKGVVNLIRMLLIVYEKCMRSHATKQIPARNTLEKAREPILPLFIPRSEYSVTFVL